MKRNIFLMAAVAVSIMLLGSCNSEVADDANANVATIDTTHCTTFVIKETPTTRVSITGHVPNGGAVVNWIPDDKLWLRTPADARIGSMGNNLTGVSAWAKFYFPAGYNDATYQVNYLGHTTRTDGRHVTIHPSQWQGVPNNTDHLQYVGDCAEGVAYRDANKAGVYNLTLRRLPAYLCIMPYCTNEMLRPGAKITKIVVRSDNAITGTFDVAASKFTAGINLGKQIENALNSGNGFSLENNAPNQALNAAYFVIIPGVHTLTIDYYYTSPQSSSYMMRKVMAARDYRANTMTDIYANIDFPSFDVKYYMWDAAEDQDLFVGREQKIGVQMINTITENDPRLSNYNAQEAQRSARFAPNLNQMAQYLSAGFYLDNTTEWTCPELPGGRAKGGYWFKKLSAIARDMGINEAAFKDNYYGTYYIKTLYTGQDQKQGPIDLRTANYGLGFGNMDTDKMPFNVGSSGYKESIPNINDYFFVPYIAGSKPLINNIYGGVNRDYYDIDATGHYQPSHAIIAYWLSTKNYYIDVDASFIYIKKYEKPAGSGFPSGYTPFFPVFKAQ